MSQEIMFTDMLNHYSLKTSEVSDLLSTTVAYLNKSVTVNSEGWITPSSEKFLLRIAEMKTDIRKANDALDVLMTLFNTIKNNELEAQLNELDAGVDAQLAHS